VNDMLIISTNMNGVNDTKKYLTSKFKIKDLNEIDTISGIKVKKNTVRVLLFINLIVLGKSWINLIIWMSK